MCTHNVQLQRTVASRLEGELLKVAHSLLSVLGCHFVKSYTQRTPWFFTTSYCKQPRPQTTVVYNAEHEDAKKALSHWGQQTSFPQNKGLMLATQGSVKKSSSSRVKAQALTGWLLVGTFTEYCYKE